MNATNDLQIGPVHICAIPCHSGAVILSVRDGAFWLSHTMTPEQATTFGRALLAAADESAARSRVHSGGGGRA